MEFRGKHIFLFDLAVDLSVAERDLAHLQHHGADASDVQELKECVQELRDLMKKATVKDLIDDLKMILNNTARPLYDKSRNGEKLLYRYKTNW